VLLQQPLPAQGRALLPRRRARLARAGQERRAGARPDYGQEQAIDTAETIDELRRLIVRAAPDPALAAPVADCHEDEPLDNVIPFSSLILLGVVVALEDRFGIVVTGGQLASACRGGPSLRKLALMIEEQSEGRAQ
jgi:hypothetical protein